jgi:predicted ATPase/DNA-binding XRE family transcriptional regulator
MHPNARFGECLRQYRIAASLTQEALAERAGLSVRGISDLERGINARPRLETVRLLADALGLSAEERAALASSAQPALPTATPEARDDQAFTPPPVPPTSLLGREAELATISGLLREPFTRLVTLTGPGGIGKTRLAHAVMVNRAADFTDGARFVSLAALRDPALVIETIAQALGLPDSGDQPVRRRLLAHLHARYFLLVLDNFEQLLAAAPDVADLIAHCPTLTILVTSRAALRVSAEQEWPVPPLGLPQPAPVGDLSALTQSPAIVLFIQRARAVDPAFRLDETNAAAVAALCARLDGLPLAIELAAARVKLLPPQAMLGRMAEALPLLAGGPRDQPARQRTLRDTIAWSYDLLTPTEQAVFACLSVFVGGWTLAAVEAVYAAIGGDARAVLDLTAALVDHNLIHRDAPVDGEPRFGMLETIREYARERLIASGRQETVARAHAAWYLAFGDQFYQTPSGYWADGMNEADVLARIGAEHDNLRAALGWAVAAQEAELALRLAHVTKIFWQIRGHVTEGRRWFAAALALATDVPPPLRAAALDQASMLARLQGDYAAARALAEEGLALWRELDAQSFSDAKRGLASMLFIRGQIARDEYDDVAARALLEESLALGREQGDGWRMGFALLALGELARRGGEQRTARSQLEESLRLLREWGNTHVRALPLQSLGLLAHDVGDDAKARVYLEESLAIGHIHEENHHVARTLQAFGRIARDAGDDREARARYAESLAIVQASGDRQGIVHALIGLGAVDHRAGDDETAETRCTEALQIAHAIGEKEGIAACLEVLAAIAAVRGMTLDAARLWAAAAALRAAVGIALPPVDRAQQEQTISAARAGCTESAWRAAWEEGRAMDTEQAVRCALRIPQDR